MAESVPTTQGEREASGDLADFLGLTEEQRESLRSEIKAAFDAIAESERQAAINSQGVWIR